MASLVAQIVKNLPAVWGRSPGGGHSYSLQYSFLENPMDRGVWWDTVHGANVFPRKVYMIKIDSRKGDSPILIPTKV